MSAAIPKEIFPVFDKPLIYYAIEELKQAGVEEVYVVVSPWKLPLFESFFHINDRYGRLTNDPSKDKILKKLAFLSTWPEIKFVIQNEAQGLAEAIGLCRTHINDEPFFVLLPDEVFVSAKDSNPCLDILNAFKVHHRSVVGLYEVPKSEVVNYGIAELGEDLGRRVFELIKLVEKPAVEKTPSTFMLPGRYLFESSFWTAINDELTQVDQLKGNQELHITHAMDRMASEEKILGAVISGDRFDAGRPEGLLALSQFEFSRTKR